MKISVLLLSLLSLLVCAATAQDTIQVKTGWNNIGAISGGPIGEVLETIPPGIIQTSFFGYEPGSGYQTSDTLLKGTGYWIKVSADGLVIFNPTVILDSCSVPEVAYEGGPYPTVKVGNQCWFAKNLNVGTMVNGMGSHEDNSILEKYCYDNDTNNCNAFGGLYERDEAMQYNLVEGTQGICPSGWHVATIGEYQALLAAVGGDANALKALGQGSGPGAGTDTSGFGAMLAGLRMLDGTFAYLGDNGYFSTSSPAGGSHYFIGILIGNANQFLTNEAGEKWYGGSVRCVQN